MWLQLSSKVEICWLNADKHLLMADIKLLTFMRALRLLVNSDCHIIPAISAAFWFYCDTTCKDYKTSFVLAEIGQVFFQRVYPTLSYYSFEVDSYDVNIIAPYSKLLLYIILFVPCQTAPSSSRRPSSFSCVPAPSRNSFSSPTHSE